MFNLIHRKTKRKNDESKPMLWGALVFFAVCLLLIILGVSLYLSEEMTAYSPEEYANMGIEEMRQGNYDPAIDYFTATLELAPDYPDIYFWRANAYSTIEDYSSAIDDYGSALEHDPNNASIYYNRGWVYHEIGEYEAAITDLDAAIALYPSYAYAYNNRGYANSAMANYEAAVADYTRSIALDPSNAYPYNNRAYANFRLGNMETVFADYARSIALDSGNSEVFHNRGITYYELGSAYYEEAIADYLEYAAIEGEFEDFMLEQIEAMQATLSQPQ